MKWYEFRHDYAMGEGEPQIERGRRAHTPYRSAAYPPQSDKLLRLQIRGGPHHRRIVLIWDSFVREINPLELLAEVAE